MEPISSLSREWIPFFVRGASGTEQVHIAFTNPGAEPVDADWKAAEWNPASVTARGADARILLGPDGAVTLPDGTYQAWVRVTASVERPVLPAGLVDII